MKNISSFLFLLICFLSLNAQDIKTIEYPFAAPGTDVTRGVFGSEDDRKEVKDAEGYEDFVRATAVMISKKNIYNNEFYSWSLREKLQRQFKTNKFSDNVKFLDQPAIGSCTGFLIAPDILVTAGHCVKTMEDANNFVWVFDYTSETKFTKGRKLDFKPENIFEVKSIIKSKLDAKTKDDYAFLKLKKKSKRDPYRFRTSGTVKNKTKVNTLGSPTGLPLKFTTNAIVVNEKPENWFLSSLDNFPGNSGGPVFDQNGFVEGILVRGMDIYSKADGKYTGDYMFNTECNCVETVSINSYYIKGDCESHKINAVPSNILIRAVYDNLYYAIINNLSDRFDSWHAYNWIYNYNYAKNNGRLENLAITNNNMYALKRILKTTASSFTDSYSRELIDMAMVYNNLNALQLILDNDILADAGIDAPYTALQEAVTNGKLDFAITLIDYGADTKVKTSNNDNLLHLVARSGNMELAKLLVKEGVNAKSKNKNKRRPEKVAKKARHRSLAKYLKKVRKGRL